MSNELSIRCTYGTKVDFPLKGRFVDKATNKVIVLLNDYRVAIDRQLASHERQFQYVFTANKKVFDFTWNDDQADRAEFAKWLKQHPDIDHADNKNKAGTTYFALVDKSRQDEVQYEKENTKVAAYQLGKNMKTSTLMEVAFFNLTNPVGMSAKKLFNFLFGLEDGIVMRNPRQFLAEWSQKDISKRVVMRKAIILGLIESQAGIFYIDKTPIGSPDNLLVYLTDNDKYYTYLSSEVAKKDTFPYDVVVDVSVAEALEAKAPKEKKDTTTSAATKEVNKLDRESKARSDSDRAEAQKLRLRDLNVKGWSASLSWSEEVRLKKIEEAEKTEVVA